MAILVKLKIFNIPKAIKKGYFITNTLIQKLSYNILTAKPFRIQIQTQDNIQ
jgi:hypothetical protein